MTRGAGQCCIVMAINLWYVVRFMVALKDIAEGNSIRSTTYYLGDEFLSIQIGTWVMWTATESYYTWQGVEWEIIGPIHVFLCIVVLAFSITAKVYYSQWVQFNK